MLLRMDREALLTAGASAYATGRLADAEACYRSILGEAPLDAEVLSNLGAVLNTAQCHEAAEAACRAALQVRPRYWAALANLGNALHRQQRYDLAVNAYHAAVEANPRNASAWTNLGVALNEQWDMENALAAHDAAAAIAPQDAQIRANRAMAMLIAGDYINGFAEFEWRWRTPGMAAHGVTGRQWQGADPAGCRILLHQEGGFGDTLQFVRYAPLLAARGATVIVRVHASLLALLRRSFPGVTFVADGEVCPPADLQCPMLSLPYAFGTALETVPAGMAYLRPCSDKTAYWRDWLAGCGYGLRVGLVWAGAPLLGMAEFRAMNHRRSISQAALAPLFGCSGVQFVSLQVGEAKAREVEMLRPEPALGDFDDTAALVANLDLVIAVDTAVAHLAGALGKPVWVMSRFDACWRWLAHRRDTPWYPSMRLYRQARPGDWGGVIEEVARDVQMLSASAGLGRRTC